MNRRNYRQVLVALGASLILAHVPDSQAGTVTSAAITQVTAESPNGFFVYVNTTPANVPACGTVTSGNNRFVIDPTTDAGRAMIAVALMAFTNKTSIDIIGTGTCDVWGDTETVYYIIGHQS